ncbi:hypothetical protein [Robiginitalea sp. SC105]|nr:hypothetical protein [Robiginitalea sp. SC105]MBC2838320.1 hypothetical protein [Robiginitalea sp. SC105]
MKKKTNTYTPLLADMHTDGVRFDQRLHPARLHDHRLHAARQIESTAGRT